MHRRLRTFCLLSASILVSYGHAEAATTLRTPFILAGTELDCFVTNIGTKPLEVTVSATDAVGASLASVADTCTGTLVAPQRTCVVVVTAFPTVPTGGFCSFRGKGKFRAVGYGVNGTSVTAVPAAK